MRQSTGKCLKTEQIRGNHRDQSQCNDGLKFRSESCYNLGRGVWVPTAGAIKAVCIMVPELVSEVVVGRQCRLLKPVRDQDGRTRFAEHPRILREVSNLDRRMYLVEIADRATTFLFPNEMVNETPALSRAGSFVGTTVMRIKSVMRHRR